MSIQPRLSQIPLWRRHVNVVLAVIREALVLLSADPPTGQEPEFNRELDMCILRAIRERHLAGKEVLDQPIFYEARNQPSPDTKGTSSERKIPDFQSGYIDHQEPDPLRSARFFVIECKRLGYPSSSGWVFSSNYIHEGVVRFIDPDWRYGKDVADGAMVGYMESMTLNELIAAVNKVAGSLGIPSLAPSTKKEGPLYELIHILDRNFPVTPFTLQHLWIKVSQT